MTTPLRRRGVAAVLLLSLVLAACSSSGKVGDEDLLAFDPEQAKDLGATTTTAGADPGAQVEGTTTTAPPAAAANNTTLPPQQQEVTVEVVIQDDEQGAPFTPNVVRVAVKSKVRFLNKGTKTYSIVAQNGAFTSPPIAPGGAWIYEASTPGNFNYSDDVRTYAQGTIQVVG